MRTRRKILLREGENKMNAVVGDKSTSARMSEENIKEERFDFFFAVGREKECH